MALTHATQLYRSEGKLDEILMERIESRHGKSIKYKSAAPRM